MRKLKFKKEICCFLFFSTVVMEFKLLKSFSCKQSDFEQA